MGLLKRLITSKELKKLIVQQSHDFNIPIKYACSELRIDYDNLMAAYINSKNSETFTMSEERFIEFLEFFGIVVRHQIVIDENKDLKKLSENLITKYDVTKEKRSTEIPEQIH
jgi:single-stranded DNA-specific DHH superfamily exonuclease